MRVTSVPSWSSWKRPRSSRAVLGGHVGHLVPAHPDEHRAGVGDGVLNGLTSLQAIGGDDDVEARKGAQPGQVFDGMMGRAELSVGHPGLIPHRITL